MADELGLQEDLDPLKFTLPMGYRTSLGPGEYGRDENGHAVRGEKAEKQGTQNQVEDQSIFQEAPYGSEQRLLLLNLQDLCLFFLDHLINFRNVLIRGLLNFILALSLIIL